MKGIKNLMKSGNEHKTTKLIKKIIADNPKFFLSINKLYFHLL